MKWANICLYAAVVLPRIVPLERCVRFLSYTSSEYRDSGSMDTWNDYAFAQSLMGSYAFAASVSLGLVWMRNRADSNVLWAPILFAFVGVATVILIKPEEVIVFFPRLYPALLSGWYVIWGMTGFLIFIANRALTHFLKEINVDN